VRTDHQHHSEQPQGIEDQISAGTAQVHLRPPCIPKPWVRA
jgi:hypothetical protein